MIGDLLFREKLPLEDERMSRSERSDPSFKVRLSQVQLSLKQGSRLLSGGDGDIEGARGSA